MSTVLTSCGRFDLLEETVETFREDFDSKKIPVAEEADLPAEVAEFATRNPVTEVCINSPKLGQMRSIDKPYASIGTPYVLHLEDDWGFTQGIDLDAVTDFLEARPGISVACIALVEPGIAERIGDDRHAHDPFLPARAKTIVSRLRRSVAKRWGNLVPQPQIGIG